LPRPAACVGLRTHNARQRVDRLGASRSADVLEQSEPVRDQRSARARRRIRQELVATKLRTHGPASNDAVLREITLGDASPVRLYVFDECARELAAVQLLRAVIAQYLERRRQIGDDECVSHGYPPAVALADRAALVAVA